MYILKIKLNICILRLPISRWPLIKSLFSWVHVNHVNHAYRIQKYRSNCSTSSYSPLINKDYSDRRDTWAVLLEQTWPSTTSFFRAFTHNRRKVKSLASGFLVFYPVKATGSALFSMCPLPLCPAALPPSHHHLFAGMGLCPPPCRAGPECWHPHTSHTVGGRLCLCAFVCACVCICACACGWGLLAVLFFSKGAC